MVMTITFDTKGFDELAKKLQLANTALHNRKKPHQKARDYMSKRWRMNFNSEGAIYGAWQPLAPWTLWYHGPHKPLKVSGTLQSGFFAQAGAPTTLSASQTIWVFQRNPIYLFAQAFGNKNTSSFAKFWGLGPVPARKLWGINGEDEEQLRVIFDHYCQEVIARYLG